MFELKVNVLSGAMNAYLCTHLEIELCTHTKSQFVDVSFELYIHLYNHGLHDTK